MSIASVVGQVVYKRKSGVYMPALMCDKGDLYQEYDGDSLNPINPSPDFTVLQPTLSYVITSSLEPDGVVVPNSVAWYFGEELLTFDSANISTNKLEGGSVAGHFEFLPYKKGTRKYFGLKIKKNLVKAAQAAPCSIRAVATIIVGNNTDKIQFVYNIPITYGVGNSKRVTIMSGDNNNFTIRTKTDSVRLKAVARVGGEELSTSSGLTYKWFKLEAGSWSALSESSQILTVTEPMVVGACQFKVEVSQNGSLIGMDVQTVIDATEPYDIIVNANPANETIDEEHDRVTYRPILVRRGETTPVKAMRFYFTFMSSSGLPLNSETCNIPSETGFCDIGMCNQEQGNVAYNIMTEE